MHFPLYLILLTLALLFLLTSIILYWRRYSAVPPQAILAEPSPKEDATQEWPSISVVIITHDSDHLLERAIDTVAAQNYPDFEIVVVNNASTDDTNDVLKRATKKHPTLLRTTHLPQNRNGILHMSMAATLGVRASRKEWIVLLRPNSTPKSTLWLRSIANAINQGNQMCIGYNHYYGYYTTAWEKRATLCHRKAQLHNFRAIRRGARMPIEAEASNFAFRKEDFMSNGGYGKWLNIKNYHEHLYAATFAQKGQTAMLTLPDSQVETLLPPIKELWQTEQHLTHQAYKRLPRHTKWRRTYYTRLAILALVALVTLIAGVGLSISPLSCDNSATILPYHIFLPGNQTLSAASTLATILFAAISLIHLITANHCRRRDIKRLTTPLVTNVEQLLQDEF